VLPAQRLHHAAEGETDAISRAGIRVCYATVSLEMGHKMALNRQCSLLLGVTASGLLYCAGLMAQSYPVASRIVDPIDESRLVTLTGYAHPSANAANDRGPAPDNMQLERMHLALKRGASQETALRQLIGEMHTPGTANYRKWMTPDEFGKRFGPSDEDLATVKSWLEGHGFSVAGVNPGRQTIEFSGNVAQMRAAFHTQIHKYEVNGESHYANAGDPRIPAALTPVVGGFVSLNNFRLKSYAHLLGRASYDPKTGKATPEWTTGNSTEGISFALAPQDYAVQYDLNPLYKAGIDGSGQTIAIVNESNIDILLANNFRSLFGLPYNPPRIIIDGNDPGVDGINNPDGPNGASVEAYLDVEWAGAVAPKAQIDLVIGGDTALENGLILALEHAIYGNLAPVISMSFGNCEEHLGSYNQFFSSLYEQAAAQGITMLVSTGDSGSANCDSSGAEFATHGQMVSGLASTPFNVAVGGTDFYYSAYNSGSTAINQQLATYWNFTTSNSTPAVSILGVIPEQPWNNSQYGLNLYNEYTETDDLITTIAGGGGGASNSALCSGAYDSSNTCTGTLSGYAKPAWQSGPGVPSDGVRDIPDLSLFASNGVNYSYYPFCYYDGDCQPVASGQYVQFSGVGGTSASTPAFAGIMAMVNQQYGRQGQADYVLYPLAAQFPDSFHDVAVGANSVPCDITSTGCIPVSDPAIISIPFDPSAPDVTEGQIGAGTTAFYNAGPGYDLATGLGAVDAANLVKNWNKVSFAATKTTLTPSQTSFAHGTAITISGAVTAAGGTPSGDVALMAGSTEQTQQGQTLFTLSSGSYSGSVNYLPGGTYDIWGQYGGDVTNGLSTSTPVQISVTPEPSAPNMTIIDTTTGLYLPSGTTGVKYGDLILLEAQPAPSANSSKTFTMPTGTVTFADNGTPLETVVLNSIGEAECERPFAVGSHSITASYSGDQSYNASTAAPSTFSIIQGTPWIGYQAVSPAGLPAPGSADGTLHLSILAYNGYYLADAYTAEPTGTVTLSSTPAGITGSAALIPSIGKSLADFLIQAPPGNYQVTVDYSGDANYQAGSQLITSYGPIEINLPVSGLGLPSTTTATVSGSISPTTSITVNVTIAGQNGQPAPTGWLVITDAGRFQHSYIYGPGSGSVTTLSFVLDSQILAPGDNFLSFLYEGDSVYNPSKFVLSTPIVDPAIDFTLVPDSSIIPVAPGNSAKGTINLTSVNSFSGAIAFTCTVPSAITCSIPPSVSLAAAGVATTSVTISAAASTPLGSYDVLIVGTDSTGKFVHTLGLTAIVGNTIAGSKDFVLTNGGNITVKAGAATGNTSSVTITSTNGFSGTVTLSCVVTTSISAPNDPPTCALAASSASVSSSLSPTIALTMKTTAATSASQSQKTALFWPSAGATALGLLFLVRVPKRRRGWLAMLGLLVLALSIASLGCNTIIYGNRNNINGTTPGVYTVTVTGNSDNITHTTALTLTVN
jgi:hypothetical protein